jgi:serine/threonine-protein kinase
MAPSIPHEEETRIGTLISGKYRIEQRLGAGAVGEVFRARNVLIGRDVAIKFMRREHVHNDELVERFVREAQAVSRVRHPHVVDVLDVGVEEEIPYIVEELLLGEDLSAYVRRKGGKLSVRSTLELLLPAMDGIAYAHERGVVHRDLKPENIFLARTDDGVVPKVLDFGISKVKTDNLRATVTGAVFGTPGYMSPEQVHSFAEADARSDVWALGVMLYELLAGRIPFEAQEPNALMVEVCTRSPLPLAEAAPEVPADLTAIVDRCLAKSPDDRFDDAGALAKALRKLAGAPERVTRLQFVKISLPPFVEPGEDGARVSSESDPLAVLQALPHRVSAVQPVRVSIVSGDTWELDLTAAVRQLRVDNTLAGTTIGSRPPPKREGEPANRLPALAAGLAVVSVTAVTFLTMQNHEVREASVTAVRAVRGTREVPRPPPAPGPVASTSTNTPPASVDLATRPTKNVSDAPLPRRHTDSRGVAHGTEPAQRFQGGEAPMTVVERLAPPTHVSGTALEAQVRRAMVANMSQVVSCIEQARSVEPSLAGRVAVRLTVAPEGPVREAIPIAPRGMQPFARCLAQAMGAWNVGPTGATTDSVLTWPFELTPP